MKATIQGIAVDGTPSEVAEYRRLVEEAPVALKPNVLTGQAMVTHVGGLFGVVPSYGSGGVTTVVGQAFAGTYTLKYTELGTGAVVPPYPPNFTPAYEHWGMRVATPAKLHVIPGATMTFPPHSQAASVMEELGKMGWVGTFKTEGT